MSSTAQRIASHHSVGCDRNQAAALSAVLPPTMSNRLVAANVDDRGAPNLGAPPAFPPEQRFLSMPTASTVPTRSVSASSSASPQRPTSLFTVCQSQPKFCGDLLDRTAPPTHLDGYPPGRSGGQQRPLGTNLGVLFDERPDLTVGVRARPATFPPPQPHRPTERR